LDFVSTSQSPPLPSDKNTGRHAITHSTRTRLSAISQELALRSALLRGAIRCSPFLVLRLMRNSRREPTPTSNGWIAQGKISLPRRKSRTTKSTSSDHILFAFYLSRLRFFKPSSDSITIRRKVVYSKATQTSKDGTRSICNPTPMYPNVHTNSTLPFLHATGRATLAQEGVISRSS
jgi:hypothetical protein